MSETMERVWIRIPTDLKTALEGQAARRNLRFQDVARYALADYVMNEVAATYVEDEPLEMTPEELEVKWRQFMATAMLRTLIDPGVEYETGDAE